MIRPSTVLGLAVAFATLAAPLAADDRGTFELRLFLGGPTTAAASLGDPPVQLVLDDGTIEGQSGVNGASAAQFLWLNHFAPAGQDIDLEEVRVLFPPGANMVVGNAVQIVVLTDDDGDPTNGATFVAGLDAGVQAVDGSTFSSYLLDPAVPLGAADDILIGVVPRFVKTGVTSPTFPAAVDTTAPQGRSWIALWSGDPPAAPSLPSDGAMTSVAGNWTIRGFGTPSAVGPTVLEVPSLSPAGLGILATLLALAGIAASRRRRV